MISKTLKRYRSLSQTARSVVLIYWIYEFAGAIAGMFLGLFVFLETKSIELLLTYNLSMFFGVFVGFCVWGALMAQFQVSMKYNALRSFLVYIASYMIILFLPREPLTIIFFGFLTGLGLGIFWIGHHAYTMEHTKDKDWDFFSSMLAAGTQTVILIAPLIATLTFFLSEKVFEVGTFIVLFWIIPFVYLLGLPFVFHLPDYTPKKIPLKTWKTLLLDPDLKWVRRFALADSAVWPLYAGIIPIIALEALGSVINIGIFQTALAVLSILIVLYMSHHRHKGNRVQILFRMTLIFMFGFIFLFFWKLTPFAYITFILIELIFDPIYRVSQHTLELESFERMNDESDDSYAGIVCRDLILSFGRLMSCLVLLSIYWLSRDTFITVQASILLIIIVEWCVWWSAKKMHESPR